MKPTNLDMWIASLRQLGYEVSNASEAAKAIGKDEMFVHRYPPSINPFSARAA